jgi:hypothetical protein
LAKRTRDHQHLTACRDALTSPRVFAGLDPAIHDEAQRVTSVQFWRLHRLMDARVKSPRMTPSVWHHRATLSGANRYDRPSLLKR